MRDPADPANPYAGQYAAYDVWIYARAWDAAQGGLVAPGTSSEAGQEQYTMSVDKAGWPVPLVVEQRESFAPKRVQLNGESECKCSISAWGVMSRSLQQNMEEDRLSTLAAAMPRIPEWLMLLHPHSALLLPDGEVITLAAGGAMDAPGQLARYDGQGRLLATLPSGSHWWEFYFEGFSTLEKRHPGDRWIQQSAFVSRYDSQSRTLRESYDYRGKRIRQRTVTVTRGCFEWLEGAVVEQLWTAQQAAQSGRNSLPT